jgi:hypothetical protein
MASGQVRFFGMSDCARGKPDGYRFVSRPTGEATAVRVRRKVVDARYLETSIPATHTPSFGAEPGVRLIPVNDQPSPSSRHSRPSSRAARTSARPDPDQDAAPKWNRPHGPDPCPDHSYELRACSLAWYHIVVTT